MNERKMFGKYKLDVKSGVNPPWTPSYPAEWGYASAKKVEIMTKIDPKQIQKLFETGKPHTPFELVNDRMAIQFILSYDHTMSYHKATMMDMKAVVPVRYENYFALTDICAYNSDTIGVMAGRELCGYPEKDCRFGFNEAEDGTITCWINRRGRALAEFKFTPDAAAPIVPIVDGAEQPAGELHVRRVPDISKLDTAYADVVYCNAPISYTDAVAGQVELKLYDSEYDLLAELKPEILSAQVSVTGPYDGSRQKENRKLVKQLL